MKNSIFFLALILISSTITAQDRPSCLKMVDSKIKSLEKAINQLQDLASNPSSNQFQITLNRNQGKVKSMRGSLENCKKSNSDYDYTADSARIDDVASRFESIISTAANSNADREKVIERTYQLKDFIAFIEIFPSQILEKEDRENYALSDTQSILELAKNDSGSLGVLKEEYEQALQTIESPDFLDRVYSEIDFEYSRQDPLTLLEELNKHLVNFQFIGKAVFPNNTKLSGIEDYIQKLVSKKQTEQSKTLSSILVSDFHGKHLNKILFTSNLSLNPETATATDFKTEFEAGQPIKAIAYLDNTYHKIYGRTNRPAYEMLSTKNSGQLVSEGFVNSEGSKPYVVFNIVQDGATYTATKGDYPGTAIAMEYLASFSPRTHSVEVILDSYLGNAQGEAEERDVVGTFSFDASKDSGLEKMKNSVAAIRDKSLATVALPKAGMRNQTYESKLIDLFNSMGWDEKFTKAIIGSQSFGYKKNYLDQVTGRTLQVYMVSKKSDGGCMYQDFTVIQEKVGGGWAAFKRLSTGSQKDISCGNI